MILHILLLIFITYLNPRSHFNPTLPRKPPQWITSPIKAFICLNSVTTLYARIVAFGTYTHLAFTYIYMKLY